jgi:hypothetical protein
LAVARGSQFPAYTTKVGHSPPSDGVNTELVTTPVLNPSPSCDRASLDRPERHGVLVLDEQEVARDHGVGIGLLVRDLKLGQLFVCLVVGLEDCQL